MLKTYASSALFALLVVSSLSFGYQVTGKVEDVTDTKIVVMKGKEKFEISKDGSTKSDAVKKGDKVTVEYSMTATSVSAKK